MQIRNNNIIIIMIFLAFYSHKYSVFPWLATSGFGVCFLGFIVIDKRLWQP
jgi:hypothetical protein